MASLGANFSRKKAEGINDDFGLREYVAEGVEALVPYRGNVKEILNQMAGGLRSGMSYSGAKTIFDLWLEENDWVSGVLQRTGTLVGGGEELSTGYVLR